MALSPVPWLEPRWDRVERCPALSVADLRRVGILVRGRPDGFWGLAPVCGLRIEALFYDSRDELLVDAPGAATQILCVGWTPCGFGGQRPSLICPRCGLRKRSLYLRHGFWACRGCQGLRYESQRLNRADRGLLRGQRVRERFGQQSYRLGDPLPLKPDRMRWVTYMSAAREVREAELTYLLCSRQG
jgi:hypothetical protein